MTKQGGGMRRDGRTLGICAAAALCMMHGIGGCGGTQRNGSTTAAGDNPIAGGEPVPIGTTTGGSGQSRPGTQTGGTAQIGRPGVSGNGGSVAFGGWDGVGSEGGTGTFPTGWGGVGSEGGVSDYGGDGPIGGAGSELHGAVHCGSCSVVAVAHDLRGVATTDSGVYWIDHGSVDALGNYQGDGQLAMRPLPADDAGEVEQLLNDHLDGPTDLATSSAYAYVLLDESTAAAGKGGLARVPLGGGAAELLRSFHIDQTARVLSGHFASSLAAAFWLDGNAIYRAPETAQATLASFADGTGVLEIFGDGASLYEYDGQSVYSLPVGGGDRTLLQALDGATYSSFMISSGFIYALESTPTGLDYLTRMPQVGWAMKRLSKVGTPFSHVLVAGDRWILATYDWVSRQRQIWQESIAAPAAERSLVTAKPGPFASPNWGPMALSSGGLFFANQERLYLVPFVP